ncbi:MAG: peptidoglycan-binding protein [Rhizobiaceae bacterium]
MQRRLLGHVGRGVLALVLITCLSLTARAANNEAVGLALKELISNPNLKTGSATADANIADIKAFYASRSFKPIWSRDTGPKGKAKALLGELKASTVHGLLPDFYGVGEIANLMKSLEPADLARMDFLFSGALVDFSHDLLNGRLTNLASYERNRVDPVRLDPAALIEKAAAAGNLRTMLAEIVGDDRRYLRLVAKMIEYVRLEQSRHWPTKIGKADFAKLRRLLALTGDLPFDQMTKKGPIDATLSDAIRSYQGRMGLQADGKLGPATLEELNTPLSARIQRIKVNLERRRWQNRATDQKLFYLNMVDGQLKLTINDKTRALTGVSLGEAQHKLPTFYGTITGARSSDSNGQGNVELVYDAGESAGDGLRFGSLVLNDGNQGAITLLEEAIDATDKAALAEFKSNGGELKLARPIDLFVTYLTVWATRNGKIQFRPDIFQRDAKVIDELGL